MAQALLPQLVWLHLARAHRQESVCATGAFPQGVKALDGGRAAVGLRACSGVREFHDLIDGVNGFAFTAAAADIEHAGDELILDAARIRERLKLILPAGDESRNSNGLSAMTTDNRAKSFGNYGR